MQCYSVWHDEMHGTRHDHRQKDATRCAREVRTRTPGCVLLAALFSLLVVFVTPISAFAQESGGGGGHSFEGPNVGIIFYGPTPALDSNANQVNEVGVTAYNEFDAAAYVLGYSYGEVRSWSSDIRAKLSNSETGGRFWQFAKTFTHTNNIDGIQWFFANVVYGADLCWRSLYSDDLYRNALVDCQKIINGEDIGGGGGSSGDEVDGYTILRGGTNNEYVYNLVPVATNGSGGYSLETSKIAYKIAQYKNEGLTIAFGVKRINVSSVQYPIVLAMSQGVNLVRAPNGQVGLYNTTDETKTYKYNAYDTSWIWNVDANGMISLADGGMVSGTNSLNAKSFTTIYGTNLRYVDYFYCEGGSTTPVVPPTNWPEEPEAPEPPELPEPEDPVIEPPEPYEPTTGPTYIYNFTNTSEPTDTSDLLEWIKKIFYELKAIHSDLKTWFENFGNAISDGFEAMDNACGQIYGAITEQTDEMTIQFSSLKIYLRQLFNWLGEKMNFQASGYDDTSVIYWLKRIWSKLGNGDINVRPTDPTTDPTGVWDWLIKLVQNFLIGLASSANDLISEMADLISQVMHQFPFSIPWDIAAFLAAFAAAPITPDVDVTIPAIEGWWGETVISIDLSPYDTAAAAVRAMEKILFAAFLAWKSKDLLEFMDVTKWFNG